MESQTQSSPSFGFKDQGTFFIYINEENIGVIEFEWHADNSYRGSSSTTIADQPSATKIKITPDANGLWQYIVCDSPLGSSTLTRRGTEVRYTFKKKTHKLTIPPEAEIYDSYSPALLSQVLQRYDKERGGEQTFPLLITTGIIESLTLRLTDRVERSIGGYAIEFNRFRCLLKGADVIVWTDLEDKVYLLEVPSYKSAFVREGYESLRQQEESETPISAPAYTVQVEKNVPIPMRDGVELATDIYRPESSGEFPVILIRSPYKKELEEIQALFYARRGYVVAAQDVRGRFSSPGLWEPFVNEGPDGYDTIEWLAQQSWSTSKVGMIGGSYLGYVQWRAAIEQPPHLVTIIPIVCPTDPFYNVPYEYGVFFLSWAIWWVNVMETNATADMYGPTMKEVLEKRFGQLIYSLPVLDIDKQAFGKENPYWRNWIQHPNNDSYWQHANFLDRLQDVAIPVFHQTGWFDGNSIGTKLNYLSMISHGRPFQKLVIGPWGHASETRAYAGRDFGAQALVDMQQAYLRWFDYWLKGMDNAIDREPLVGIFIMGSNRWLESDVYPFPQTRFEKWFLTSKGWANTSKGDGKLVRELAEIQVPSDRFTYDPNDPTPDTRLFASTPAEAEEPDGSDGDSSGLTAIFKKLKRWLKSLVDKVFFPEYLLDIHHEQVTDIRKDILVYTSEPFTEPYTFAGPISAVLYASSSARDTDWHMNLIEIEASGKFFVITHGTMRARFHRSSTEPELLNPDEVYQFNLDLWQTGITIAAGSRLRVEVASAAFPTYSRNLNTGGHNEMDNEFVKAEQLIHHSKQYPSHIVLPVIPEEPEWFNRP